MLNVFSLFSGIGAFEKALDKVNVPYNLVNYCEFDKYASKSYSLIHNTPETMNLGDITKVDLTSLKEGCADLITYGFPCQDISLAGKQAGFEKDGQLTRSGLFFYASAIIGRIKPKVAICENVKNLTSKKFEKEFKIVLDSLEQLGYNNYWKVLNAKDYGIPQNRERVFIVSIREDIDNKEFKFPEPFPLELTINDLSEDMVDDKYYLSDEKIEKILDWKAHQRPLQKVLGKNSICPTLTARGAGEYHSGMILYNNEFDNTTNCDEELKVAIKQATKKGYIECDVPGIIDLSYPSSKTRRGRVQEGGKICPTITAESNGLCKIESLSKIRTLTEKECWRLMGFDDEDIDKCIAGGLSSRQLYKQAGNSIVVDVIEEIYCALFNTVKGLI